MLKCILKNKYFFFFLIIVSCKSTALIGDINSKCSVDVIKNDNISNINNLNISYVGDLVNENKKISGSIKIINKTIFINGVYTALGIEIFRILIKNDSITYIDRINKQFYIGSLAKFKMVSEYKLLIDYLPNILFGKVFDMNELEQNDSCMYFNRIENSVIYYNYLNNNILQNIHITEGAQKFQINYDNFVNKNKVFKQLEFFKSDVSFFVLEFIEIKKIKKDNLFIKIPKNYTSL